MCTSVRIKSKENHCFWGRTQEFDIPVSYGFVEVPRNYVIEDTFTPCEVKYGFMGVSSGDLVVIDGINEAGLSGGTFYFGDENKYGDKEQIRKMGKNPLRGEEVCTWILARYKSVQEIKEHLNEDIAVANEKGSMGIALPQHTVFHDRTGASVVVEPSLDYEFKMFDNPLGVMTNQPGFDWHLKNLYNYCGLSPKIQPKAEWNGQEILTSGHGNGLFGLPGDFTAQSRFVRAAVLSSFLEETTDEKAPGAVFHILNSFDVPKGAIETVAYDIPTHTQYTSAYDLENRILYYHHYDNRCIQKLQMKEEDLEKDTVSRFKIQEQEEIIDVRAGVKDE